MRKEKRVIYYSNSGEMLDSVLPALARDAEDACNSFVDETDGDAAATLAKDAIEALQAWLKAKTEKDGAF